jgi:hypothetical protein
MDDYQMLLDSAVGTAPPSTVDLDRVVVAGRRGARRRATGMLSGTAVLVTALLLGAVSLTGGRLGSTGPGQPAGVAPAASSAAPSRPASSGPVAIAERTGPALKSVPDDPQRAIELGISTRVDLARVAPELTAAAVTSAGATSRTVTEKVPDFRYVGADGYRADAVVTTNTGTGYLHVLVGFAHKVRCTSDGVPVACHPVTGPDGELIYRNTRYGRTGRGVVEEFSVLVQRRDGSEVAISVTRMPGRSDRSGSLGPPLTLDSLVEIALDPRLTAYPTLPSVRAEETGGTAPGEVFIGGGTAPASPAGNVPEPPTADGH